MNYSESLLRAYKTFMVLRNFSPWTIATHMQIVKYFLKYCDTLQSCLLQCMNHFIPAYSLLILPVITRRIRDFHSLDLFCLLLNSLFCIIRTIIDHYIRSKVIQGFWSKVDHQIRSKLYHLFFESNDDITSNWLKIWSKETHP